MKNKLADIIFAITERCTSSCDFCYTYKFVPEAMPRFLVGQKVPLLHCKQRLSFEEVKCIVEQAVPLGLKGVQISGGEPLLEKELTKDTVKLCSNLGLSSFLYTNGIYADEKMVDELAEMGLNKARITLCSTNYQDEALHRHHLNGESDWQRSLNAIGLFRDKKIKVGTFTPVTKATVGYLKEIGRFAADLGAEYVNFHLYIPSRVRAQDFLHEISVGEHYRAIEDILELKKELAGRVEVATHGGSLFEYLSENWKKEEGMSVAKCGHSRLGIFADGGVGTCNCLTERLGNIRDEGFNLNELWQNNSKLIALRKITQQDFPPCNDCIHRNYCSPCRSFNDGNDSIAPQVCPILRTYNSLITLGRSKVLAGREALGRNYLSR